jgi:uncharacterized membrane protein
MRFATSLRGLLPFALLAAAAAAQTVVPGAPPAATSANKGMEYTELAFRWTHVLFGILWIGHLYFFNFVQGGFEGKLDGPTKKIVVPELRPRALYWFRWGAAWTWLTGIGLLGLTYYMGLKNSWFEVPDRKGLAYAMVLVCVFVLPGIYDVVAKALGAWNMKTWIVGGILIAAGVGLMHCVGKFSARALYIHTGAMFGTAMAMNVWMRIWPAQRKIITAVKNGEKPDDALVKSAGGRSRTNTYLSVPLLLMMVSNSQITVIGGGNQALITLLIVIALGFAVANLLYKKAAQVTGF